MLRIPQIDHPGRSTSFSMVKFTSYFLRCITVLTAHSWNLFTFLCMWSNVVKCTTKLWILYLPMMYPIFFRDSFSLGYSKSVTYLGSSLRSLYDGFGHWLQEWISRAIAGSCFCSFESCSLSLSMWNLLVLLSKV